MHCRKDVVRSMTTLLEVWKHLDTISPRDYELERWPGYMEIGPNTIHDQSKTTINRVLVTVFPSAKAIAKASQDKTNLVITFCPMLARETRQIVGMDLVRLRLLAKNYIAMYVLGSSWISAKDGLTDTRVDTLGLSVIRKFNIKGKESNLIPIGRVCRTPKDMNHSRFANHILSKIETSNLQFTGTLDDEVEDLILCASNIIDSTILDYIMRQGIKTVVTGSISSTDRMFTHNMGMNVIELGEFTSEAAGMKRLRHQLSTEYPELKIEFVDTDPITQVLRPYSKDMA